MSEAMASEAAREKPVVQFIERLRSLGGLKGTDIANLAGVSKATVSRWSSGQKIPHPRTQLIVSDLSYVVMRLSEYYSGEEVRAWLYAPHPQLDSARAIDLIGGGRSEEVIAILDRLYADAYL
ncbi:MAG: LacI family DNA-binding transcriptional regulator [Rhodobacter sp.]|nr:LacI family DNA-binding transcriptional regulator [Rhodobacter sp.]